MNEREDEIHFRRELAQTHRLTTSEARRAQEEGKDGLLLASVLPMIYGLAIRLKSQRGWTVEVMDLVQEASVGVLENAAKWRPELSSLPTYAHQVAESRMRNHVGREIRQTQLIIPIEDGPDSGGQQLTAEGIIEWLSFYSAQADDTDPTGDVLKAIDVQNLLNRALTERQRGVVELYLQGYTVREIAVGLAISYQAVHRHLQTGGDKLGAAFV